MFSSTSPISTMASLFQFYSRGCLSLKKSYYEHHAVQFLSNVGCSCNSVTYKKNHVPGLFGLSLEGGKGMRIVANRKEYGLRTWCYGNGSSGPQRSRSPSELIQDFHDSINAKDINKLSQLLTRNCQIQALLFYETLNGKEEALGFLEKVIDAVGSGQVVTESITEGENFKANVVWHIAWRKLKIPFTTGCSFFEFEEEDGKLLIRKITGVEEFPVKPGDLVLKLMKATTTFFDSFPPVAEGLLNTNNAHDLGKMILDLLGVDHHRPS